MYNQYLEVKDCKTGKGVFATIQIPANVAIMEMAGPVLLDREFPANADVDNYLQIGPNTFLGLSGGIDDYLNHSCDPNCYLNVVGNRAILHSLYVIPAGGQLTIDYATTSTDTLETWKMDCKCGSFKCRKVISGIDTKDAETRQKYESKNMLPLYIVMPWMIHKR